MHLQKSQANPSISGVLRRLLLLLLLLLLLSVPQRYISLLCARLFSLLQQLCALLVFEQQGCELCFRDHPTPHFLFKQRPSLH